MVVKAESLLIAFPALPSSVDYSLVLSDLSMSSCYTYSTFWRVGTTNRKYRNGMADVMTEMTFKLV